MNVAEAICPVNRKLRPDGISEHVTPGISVIGRMTIALHPEYVEKKRIRSKDDDSDSQKSNHSNASIDSIDRSIMKVQAIGLKKFAEKQKPAKNKWS